MKTYTCPDCGRIFQEGFVPSICSNCGCPSSQFLVREEQVHAPGMSTNVSPALESSNDFSAEQIINGLAVVNLCTGIIVGLIGIIGGITALNNGGFYDDTIGAISIVAGILFFAFAVIFWALLKLLVNISYRLTRIDNKTR